MDKTRALTVDEETVAAIAAEAEVDARSVWKRLAGGKVRGRAGARIDRVIAARFAERIPESDPPRGDSHN
jgi:hypothetical protein